MMRAYIKTLTGCSVWAHAATALYHAPELPVTAAHVANLVIRQEAEETALPKPDIHVAAIVPTEAGQIGINPPGEEPTPANIEIHQDYYSLEGSTTKWIGVDPSHFAVVTTTATQGGETAVATITKGVSAHKNEGGGLDILLSPAVKAKLEAIAKEVTPCAKKRRRNLRKRQGGPACGLADFVQRVGADEELQGSFAEPLTDQVWSEVDSGYGSDDPSEDPGWEGDGDAPGEEFEGDDGYFSDDDSGFFEGEEAGEGEGTLESIVFSSEEEAAAIGAALSGEEAAAAAAVWGGSTVTAGSFLAWLWGTLKEGKELAYAQQIPKESIHRVTKTKDEDETTTTADSCPTPTGEMPVCGEGCKPTSVKNDDAEATGVVDWSCSAGDSKGCLCNPEYEEIITTQNEDTQKIIDDALAAIGDGDPKEPTTECPGDITNVPSEFFLDKTSKDFCEEVMGSLDSSHGPTAYDIYGNKIPILSKMRRSDVNKRAPPENIDNYADYRFHLGYEKQDGDCLVDKEDLCRNAYQELVNSNCGRNHGSAGNRMFKEASVDVGCAKFTWDVEKNIGTDPPPEISLGERDCHDPHSHSDVHAGVQDTWSALGCRWYAEGKTMKPGDKEIYWSPPGAVGDWYQNYKITWIEDCDLVDEQNLEFPVEGDESISCATIMNSNYHKCNNGGAGGVVDAGCLRYDFYVS